jgi:glycosyltransferase involved in cell wall biosynthesis
MNKRLKIAHIISETNIKNIGGLGTCLKNLLLFIDRDKTDHVIITYQNEPQEEKFFNSLNIPVFSLLDNSELTELNPLQTIQSLTKLLKKIQPDIIQTSNHWADFYGREAGLRAKVPIIITREANMIPHETEAYKKTKLRLALKSDRIVCISHAVKKYAQEIDQVPEHLLTVIYNGISLANYEFNPRINNSFSPEFLFVARLEEQKQPQRLLKAFSNLIKQNYQCELTIIGEGSLKQECINLTQDLEISEKVIFLGYQDKPWQFVSSESIFVLTSDFEGLCNSLLEAMTTGCLCILPKIEPFLEIVEDQEEAIFYETGNLDDLTAKMILVLEMSPEQKYDIVSKARQKIEKQFTAEISANNYLNLYQTLYQQKIANN